MVTTLCVLDDYLVCVACPRALDRSGGQMWSVLFLIHCTHDCVQTSRILGRNVWCESSGISWEADPLTRRVWSSEQLLSNPNLDSECERKEWRRQMKSFPNEADRATAVYMSAAMRAGYSEQDRPDLDYATSEVARGLQKPMDMALR